jgi:Ca2+-transporting ATPase
VEPSAGLTSAEAAARLREVGPNELPPPRRTSLPVRFAKQLGEPMSVLLIVAAAVSAFALHETLEALAIIAIVALNGVIGVSEEKRAESALESLRTLESPEAIVRRDGLLATVPTREVVPGDVIVLSQGDRVAADARIVSSSSLEVDESLLTGESLPVAKDPRPVPADAPLAERGSMLLSGTLVTQGTAEAIVTGTGPASALGEIAAQLGKRRPPTPLQRELSNLTGWLGGAAIAVATGVLVLTLATARSGPEQAFLSAVALAVAAVPEGLATVVTVALAMGVRKMAGEGAIVRRLSAVETLGSTTVVLTDKTGTLTTGRMEVAAAFPGGKGAGTPLFHASALAECAILCNNAVGETGDPLDVALLRALPPEHVRSVREDRPRLAEEPFSAERARMAVVHGGSGGPVLFVKGAPEVVVARCSTVDGDAGRLDDRARAHLLAAVAALNEKGMRTIALARRELATVPANIDGAETDMTFLGLVALRDPARPEAPAAIDEAIAAGITIVMVTGDHPGTAAAIAAEVGLPGADGAPYTGADLHRDGIPDDPLAFRIYARTEPSQKLELAEALQERGEVVAVTGDGVNDAPALRRADIGVAMGAAGSDVAREAADMVITDDNLATIITAVREGRGIYDNIRKVVDYLVAGNLSEIAVVVVSLLAFSGLGVPLLPLQLLWINLLTDGLPALALALDPANPGLMRRPPRPRESRLLTRRRLGMLASRGLLMGGAALGALVVFRYAMGAPWPEARTAMFTTLVGAHLLYAFIARHPTRGLWTNPRLTAGVGAALAAQVAVVQTPLVHDLFDTVPLDAPAWVLVTCLSAAPVAAMAAVRSLRETDRGTSARTRAGVAA